MESKLTEIYRSALETFAEEGRFRTIPDFDREDVLDLTSNDYLGLGQVHEPVVNESSLFTSSASRLLSLKQKEHAALESLLAREYGRPALLFNSGYHANVGCVSALAVKGTVVLADRLVHASIIDGIRLSGGTFKRFRHNDMAHLARLLDEAERDGLNAIIVTESVFSMDGDVAPVAELLELRRKHPYSLLYIDEAHAFGVRGMRGLGICEELGVMDDVDIIAGTFGKAAASAGAFIIADKVIHDYLINTARSLIFSTALPPACHLHTSRMINRLLEMGKERERLAGLAERFREGINRITGSATGSASHIVPLMVGDAKRVLDIATDLRKQGVLALPIRRPTVPPGTERIRFALSTRLSDADLDFVLKCIENAWKNAEQQ